MAFASLNGVYVKDSDSRALERLIDRSLTEIEIPKGITKIGDRVFYGCDKLAGTVTVPQGVTGIGVDAFSGCSKLNRIDLPESLTTLGTYCFFFTKALESFVLPPNVSEIPVGMLNSSALKEFSARGDIKSIGGDSFAGCTSCLKFDFTACTSVPTLLKTTAFSGINASAKIYVPDHLYDEWVTATNWAAYADYICPVGDGIYGSLEYALGSDGASYTVTGIGSYGSLEDSGLKLFIPSRYSGLPVTAIAESAFEGNKNITSVSIPDGVTSIGAMAFCGCSALEKLTLGRGLASISLMAFDSCNALAEVHISDLAAFCGIDIPEIAPAFFKSGTKLYLNGELVTELIVPDSVTRLGRNLFHGYKYLERVEIGSHVTSVGSYAFSDCTALKEVKMDGGTIDLGTFNGCSAIECFDFSGCSEVIALSFESYPPYKGSSEILVPAALYDEWIVATNWAAIADRIVAR